MVQPIRALVADDEPEAREGMLGLLRRDPDIEVAGVCATGAEAVAAVARERPDILFLDIQMPELDGLEVVESIEKGCVPAIIFVTAYDEYALRAFDARALDYLLKPYSDERFAEALERAKERVRQHRLDEVGQQLVSLVADGAPPLSGEPADAQDGFLERIVVRRARSVSLVRTEEIDWIGAADYYAEIHAGGHVHLVRQTMQELEASLDPRRFVRIHRSTIVNVDRVRVIQPYFHGGHVVTLHDGTRLQMSRGRREALERVIGQPI
ncbi:MAG TPA: LytTR family DNA-binding domain-containing protein [Gemmatimonadales bacterium]